MDTPSRDLHPVTSNSVSWTPSTQFMHSSAVSHFISKPRSGQVEILKSFIISSRCSSNVLFQVTERLPIYWDRIKGKGNHKPSCRSGVPYVDKWQARRHFAQLGNVFLFLLMMTSYTPVPVWSFSSRSLPYRVNYRLLRPEHHAIWNPIANTGFTLTWVPSVPRFRSHKRHCGLWLGYYGPDHGETLQGERMISKIHLRFLETGEFHLFD